MPENDSTTGPRETLEEMLEQALFADPVTHRLRDEWRATKAEVQALFEKACQQQYEELLDYHRICAAPDPEEAARAEASALRILLIEERDRRLAAIWADILRRLEAVLTEKRAEHEEGGA
jgi:hypothetical protein